MDNLAKNARLIGTQDGEPKTENGHNRALDQCIHLRSLYFIRKKTENIAFSGDLG